MIKDYCAGGLVMIQNKLLILKRFNGVWLYPKGHIDPGETAEIAAMREVKEESGLTAEIIAGLGETAYTFWEKGAEHFKTVQWYLMEAKSKTVALEKDFFSDFRFVAPDEINVLTYEHDRELARKAFEIYLKL